MRAYVSTMQSGIESLPWPKEIEKMFGNADHFITHYGFDSGPKEWNTVVYFGGRYSLQMTVTVDIDYRNSKVKTNGSPPRFDLIEVDSVVHEPGGGETATISNDWHFDQTKWKRLVEANGDWSTIGLKLNTNNPVVGFNRYVSNAREPRLKITH